MIKSCKIYCDKCNKEVEQEFFKVEIIHYATNTSASAKDYLVCRECLQKLEKFLKG